jgi:HEAT repeat protein
MKSFWTKNVLFPFLLFHLFIPLGLLASDEIDSYRKKILSSGDTQKLAISNLKDSGFHILLKDVSDVLHRRDIDLETMFRIINLYESYEDKLEIYLPNAIQDYEYVLHHAQNDHLVKKILQLLTIKKDKRFLYGAIELLTHRSSEVRELVYKYLDSLKDDRILPYILELANSDSPIHHYYYLEALNFINDERLTINVNKLLNDPSPAIRCEAITVISRLGLKEREVQVLNLAKSDPNYEVRKYAILYATNKKLVTRLDIFQNGLLDPHPEVREASIGAILLFKNPTYAPFLSKALEVENLSYLRSQMLDALIATKNHGGGSGLSATLYKDPDESVRQKAARVTGILKAKMVLPTLLDVLNKDPSVTVKIEVAKTLGTLKEKSSIPVLLSKLKQPSENLELRNELLSSLNEIDDPKVMPIIFDMIEEEPTEFRNKMKEFLRTMLYRHHGTNKPVIGESGLKKFISDT